MIINYGKGKCPVCGDFAAREKENFRCSKCNISFDDFLLIEYDELSDYDDKYWT